MALAAGTRLRVYEIVAPLGAGGMGEVYRAADTKLGRSVAVKVLPEALAFDPERVGRFEREAKALAALNHPRIAALDGLEQSDSRHFLVMELVEGETLAERIARGPLRVDEALRIALQIAEALEAAHEKGIVHRIARHARWIDERSFMRSRRSHTVVAPDLRRYGDSSKPPDGEGHVNYSKRTMALDQVLTEVKALLRSWAPPYPGPRTWSEMSCEPSGVCCVRQS